MINAIRFDRLSAFRSKYRAIDAADRYIQFTSARTAIRRSSSTLQRAPRRPEADRGEPDCPPRQIPTIESGVAEGA
jgi:hypothetical protein